jgi:hypothetical protein
MSRDTAPLSLIFLSLNVGSVGIEEYMRKVSYLSVHYLKMYHEYNTSSYLRYLVQSTYMNRYIYCTLYNVLRYLFAFL